MAIFASGMGVGLGVPGNLTINLVEEAILDMDNRNNIIILDNDSRDLILEQVGRDIELRSETREIVLEKEED